MEKVAYNSPIQGEVVPRFGLDIKHTFRLFMPIFLGQLASTSMGVVDTIMAGIAGTTELSGVAIGGSFYWPSVLFVIGMTMAIQSSVAHLRGAGKSHEVAKTMHVTSVICLAVSVIVGIIVMLLPMLYNLMPNIDQDMVRVGQGYLIAIGVGMPGFALFNILRAYWEGLGNTLPTFIFGFIALLLNIPLNYIFIFGKLGMPALGGIGCGVATTITIYLTVILMLFYVKKHKFFTRFRIYEKMYPISWQETKDFLRFALPLAISVTIEVTCFSLVSLLLSPFGPIVVAAHSIALNVSGLFFMLPMTIGSATTIRVGEAMGARHWNRARVSTIGSLSLCLFFYAICVVVLFFGNDLITSAYTKDPEVHALAALLILFCATYLLPDSLQVVAIGVLRGFKDSRVIFIFTIISYWIVGMPTGYLLAYGYITDEPMAAQGFWIGFICALTTACILYFARIIYLFKNRVVPKTMIHDTETMELMH